MIILCIETKFPKMDSPLDSTIGYIFTKCNSISGWVILQGFRVGCTEIFLGKITTPFLSDLQTIALANLIRMCNFLNASFSGNS
jgi:hypothetical protein